MLRGEKDTLFLSHFFSSQLIDKKKNYRCARQFYSSPLRQVFCLSNSETHKMRWSMGTSTVFLFPATTIPKRFPRRASHQRPIATSSSSSSAGKRSNLPHKRPHDCDTNDVRIMQPPFKTARSWNYSGRMSANETLNTFQASSASRLELCASGGQNAEEMQTNEPAGPSSSMCPFFESEL